MNANQGALASDVASQVYVAPGEYDEFYAFMSGGFSGQVTVVRQSDGRLFKRSSTSQFAGLGGERQQFRLERLEDADDIGGLGLLPFHQDGRNPFRGHDGIDYLGGIEPRIEAVDGS